MANLLLRPCCLLSRGTAGGGAIIASSASDSHCKQSRRTLYREGNHEPSYPLVGHKPPWTSAAEAFAARVTSGEFIVACLPQMCLLLLGLVCLFARDECIPLCLCCTRCFYWFSCTTYMLTFGFVLLALFLVFISLNVLVWYFLCWQDDGIGQIWHCMSLRQLQQDSSIGFSSACRFAATDQRQQTFVEEAAAA